MASLSCQRNSEAIDIRHFVAAMSLSESAKLDAQVVEVLSPRTLSACSKVAQGSSENTFAKLFSSSGLSLGSKLVVGHRFLENALLEKVVGAGVVHTAAPVTQEPTENPREPPVAACRRIEEPRSDGGVR